MNRLLSTLFCLAFCLYGWKPAAAQAPSKQWDYRFGGTRDDNCTVLQLTTDGGSIVGGYSNSPSGGDKTQPNQILSSDYWIVKLDANGLKQWDRTFGGWDNEQLFALQQTTDGGYILGGTSASFLSGDKSQGSQGSFDYWVVKLDATGTKQWDRTFGGVQPDLLTALQQTSDGGYLLGGSSESYSSGDKTQNAQGLSDYWVVKLDASGTKQWDRTFGGTDQDHLTALQQTRDGGYLLGGSSISGRTGDRSQASQGSADYWVVKLDSTGTKQWDRAFGGNSFDGLTGLQQTTDGGYLLGGDSYSGTGGDKTQAGQGQADYWVLKIDSSGTKQWDRTVGGSGPDYLSSLQQTRDGGSVLVGSSLSGASGDRTQASQGLTDFWLVKLSATGSTEWDKSLGGSSNDYGYGVKQTADGSYVVGGASTSSSSGDKTQASQGMSDYWVVKLSAAPLATTAGTTRSLLSTYPNPASTHVMVRGPLGTPYQLLNQLGQVVRTAQVSTQALDVQALPAGLYLLRDGMSGRTTKLVKE